MNISFQFGSGLAAASGMTITIGMWIVSIIVHIVFCIGVFRTSRQTQTVFVGPDMWAFATLLGGVFVALAYWVVHHSSLALTPEPSRFPPEEAP